MADYIAGINQTCVSRCLVQLLKAMRLYLENINVHLVSIFIFYFFKYLQLKGHSLQIESFSSFNMNFSNDCFKDDFMISKSSVEMAL